MTKEYFPEVLTLYVYEIYPYHFYGSFSKYQSSPSIIFCHPINSANSSSEATLISALPLILYLASILVRDLALKPDPYILAVLTSPVTYLPILSTLAPPATSSTYSPALSVIFLCGRNKRQLSIRLNGHCSSSNNVYVLHNLAPNTNYITRWHLELACQFILSSRHSPDINLR